MKLFLKTLSAFQLPMPRKMQIAVKNHTNAEVCTINCTSWNNCENTKYLVSHNIETTNYSIAAA